ncbi:MAG TPA: DUF3347 domain-containing protein [Flavipsychrobacter sp.]|mgnify:CR=1 FL=1|nr:DUF3347 domain-containing protein [Flavipsychrobacter sp.]
MKRVIFSGIIIASLALASCQEAKTESNDKQEAQTTEAATEEQVKEIKPTFANVDTKVSSHVQELVDHYIHVKTALVNGNSNEAKNGAIAILNVAQGFDKSLLPADQKPDYDKALTEIENNARAIANASDLEAQRTTFEGLSERFYDLVKSFGANKPIYHDHCPMALNDKGAMWLSEIREIRNPYFGDEMLECGTVEEIVKK